MDHRTPSRTVRMTSHSMRARQTQTRSPRIAIDAHFRDRMFKLELDEESLYASDFEKSSRRQSGSADKSSTLEYNVSPSEICNQTKRDQGDITTEPIHLPNVALFSSGEGGKGGGSRSCKVEQILNSCLARFSQMHSCSCDVFCAPLSRRSAFAPNGIGWKSLTKSRAARFTSRIVDGLGVVVKRSGCRTIPVTSPA